MTKTTLQANDPARRMAEDSTGITERFIRDGQRAVAAGDPAALLRAFKAANVDPVLFRSAKPKGPPASDAVIAAARKRMGMNDQTYKMMSAILDGEITAEDIAEIPDEEENA